MILPFTVVTLRAACQKSFQFQDGSFCMYGARFTVVGLVAMFAAQEPYRYEMSGGLPPAIAASTFCSA